MLWVTATDCIGLPEMPTTRAGVLFKAKQENWEARKRAKGKGLEYSISNLPLNAQVAIKEKNYKEVLSKNIEVKSSKVRIKNNTTLDLVRQCPTLLENKTSELTNSQRAIADARCVLVREVLKLESEAKLSRIKAMTYLSELSKAEQLPDNLKAVAELANAKKGKRVGFGVRMLNQWVVDYLKAKDSAERLFFIIAE